MIKNFSTLAIQLCLTFSLLIMPVFAQAQDADAVITMPDGSSYNVKSWSFFVSQSGSTHLGGGGGSGKSAFGDLELETVTYRFTVELLRLVARGERVPTVILTDGNITLTLSDVIVSGLGIGKPGNHVVTLNAAMYEYSVGSTTTCWDIPQGVGC